MLTDLQLSVLGYVWTYQRSHRGVTPTYRLIAAELGLSSPSVSHRAVLALEDHHCIERLPNRRQAITVTLKGEYLLKEAAQRRPREAA